MDRTVDRTVIDSNTVPNLRKTYKIRWCTVITVPYRITVNRPVHRRVTTLPSTYPVPCVFFYFLIHLKAVPTTPLTAATYGSSFDVTQIAFICISAQTSQYILLHSFAFFCILLHSFAFICISAQTSQYICCLPKHNR